MTGHPTIAALIEKRLRGETSPAENARLESHLARCPACRAEWENARFVSGVFARLHRRKAGAGYREGFRRKARGRG